jgi:hypothetical protein
MCCLHQVALDADVIAQELNRKGVVGTDSADLCRGINDEGWLYILNKSEGGIAMKEVDYLAADWDYFMARCLIGPDNCRTGKASATGYNDRHAGESTGSKTLLL